MAPWLNWIEQPPPKGQVIGSNPIGVTTQLPAFQSHAFALEFPRNAIREVDIGKGWSKGGFEVILFPYLAGINKMAEDRTVSFFAPDETGHEVRFAVDMYAESKANELAGLLR